MSEETYCGDMTFEFVVEDAAYEQFLSIDYIA